MKFLPPNDDITLYEQGFEDDVLDRAKIGKSLSELVDRIEDPLVIALDGQWGAGKSFFLKRWVGAHKTENDGKAITVYFDAFANDCFGDPLVGLVAALGERLPKAQTKMKGIRVAAAKVVRPAARAALALATFGATEALSDLGDAVVGSLSKDAETAVESFWKAEEGRRAAMEEFRAAIVALQKSEGADDDVRPLVIVVDELDRCRPDYALDVLEVIKHFFAVSKVHFILGVNLSALENSVKARYGSEIDAEAYLRKFINLTFSLPDTVGDYDSKRAVPFYASHLTRKMGLKQKAADYVTDHLNIVEKSNTISVRDVGRVMSQISIFPDVVWDEQRTLYGWREAAISLAVAKIIKPSMYRKFLDATASEADLRDYFGAPVLVTEEQGETGRNQLYDHKRAIRLWMWQHLCGATNSIPERTKPHVIKLFDDWGDIDRRAEIPKKISGLWLDLFKI